MYQLQEKRYDWISGKTYWEERATASRRDLLDVFIDENCTYRFRKQKFRVLQKHNMFSSYEWVEKSFDDYDSAYSYYLEKLKDSTGKYFTMDSVWRVVK